jgi:HD-GYP domain-containing protein (c-di-GMP phosphodiesterase class II)
MNPYVILLGEVTPSDCDVVAAVAEMYDLEIRARPSVSLLPVFASDSAPIGCLSFLPCEKQACIGTFSEMPLGTGYEIPFFQRIEGEAIPDFLRDLPVYGVFYTPLSIVSASNILTVIARQNALMTQNKELVGEIMKYRKQKRQLINIGTALSSHTSLDKLLSLILAESRDLASADAGSIYIREKIAPGGAFIDAIRFKISQNDSVDVSQAAEIVMPMDKKTIAGYVGCTGEPLNIDDVYHLPESVPYTFGKDWDAKFGYRMKSMLTVPLKNLAGDVVGILQLMNKKKDRSARLSSSSDIEAMTSSFSLSDEDCVCSIGSQAAVSIERVQLYGEIESIFEGYLKSSIAAIDERDRITYGHSRRVMGYAMAFADAVNAAREGPFKDVFFPEPRKNQFRFAALLHDIGKIGVPEALLMKESRISREEIASLKMRVEYIKLSLIAHIPAARLPWSSERELDEDCAFLETINGAGFLKDEDFTRLSMIRDKYYFDGRGKRTPFLTDHEWEALSVRRGNLTAVERERINSHAVATRRILSRIPWTKDLELIPEIACHHHEKIDGSGYPDGLAANRIGFESKVLAVIDIYEALVSQDRPYKPKMSPEKAIIILRKEVEEQHLDADIVEFFIKSGVYKIFPFDRPSDDESNTN